ncbi:MAG: DNA-binding response regulator, partial [Sarcina sp.]
RAEDILTLCKLRNYNVTGCRNMIIHCYAYWLGVTYRDIDALEEEVRELNSKFTEPLSESEIKAILRCVPKAIDKFIDYEQGLRSGQVKRVSKGMRDKGGYWYKNETLIERLGITSEEEKQLKTIISEQEKNRRNAKYKRGKRRNENGLTKRQQQKQNTIKKVKTLLKKGIGVKAIARELEIAVGTVSGIKNDKY